MIPADPAVVLSAFMAGVLGSGHCMAMCGGIAGSLGALAARAPGRGALAAALQFHAGRLSGYAALGALTAGVLGMAGGAGGVPDWGKWLRAVTVLLILAMGLHYALGWRGLGRLERWGSRLWGRIAPFAGRAGARGDAAGRFLLGLCWGWLPCGLVYTVLLTAAASGRAPDGALIMLAFGVGTLPSMLGMTVAAPGLSGLLSDRGFRRFVGLSLIVLAAWMALTLWQSLSEGGAHAGHGR
jgi:sulfite exporter TauE/SafE